MSAKERKIVTHDYDEEAKKLLRSIGTDKHESMMLMSPLWQHPDTKGTIFVGSQSAAKSLALLRRRGVTHVVNCTSDLPLYHAGADGLSYLRFDIAGWLYDCEKKCGRSLWSLHLLPDDRLATVVDELRAFTDRLFAFIDSAISVGASVLVHCLAGAHRAGTTGVVCLMHYHKALEASQARALTYARKCRPIISPLGALIVFLMLFERLKTSQLVQ